MVLNVKKFSVSFSWNALNIFFKKKKKKKWNNPEKGPQNQLEK